MGGQVVNPQVWPDVTSMSGWVALLLYSLVLSGRAPSPLYSWRAAPQHKKADLEESLVEEPEQPTTGATQDRLGWPGWFKTLQLVLLLFAVFQLHMAEALQAYGERLGRNTPSLEGLTQSIRGCSMLEPGRALLYLLLSVLILRSGQIWDRCFPASQHQAVIVLRNLAFYGISLAVDCLFTCLLDCGGVSFSGISVGDQVMDLGARWHEYHQPHFLLVRMSHALTYLPVVLCLSQRSAAGFAKWRIFMLFVPDMLADWAHYADSPIVSKARLDYESQHLCHWDRHMIRTIVSFPMNWVYLTTKYGDASEL